MPKLLSLTVLAASLTLASVASGSASDIRTEVEGDGSTIRTTGYGRGPLATLRIEGDDLDVEAVAGPCPGGRPSQTVLRGSGGHRLLIAPCILD